MSITRRGFLQTLATLAGGLIATRFSPPAKPLDKITITESEIDGLYSDTTNITMDADAYKHASRRGLAEWDFIDETYGVALVYTEESGWLPVKLEK